MRCQEVYARRSVVKKCDSEGWTTVIRPSESLFEVNFAEIWRYRDLCVMFIKRDIVTMYKQTILGPLWFFIQPMMTMAMYMVVFGRIAKIPTDGVPPPLFYLAGICLWQYFANCLTKTSGTFVTNASIFGKVYFPRLVVPIATVTSHLIKLAIQLLLLVVVYLYFVFLKGVHVCPTGYVFLLPVLIALVAGLSFGFGILLSSMTTKYRDLRLLLSFMVQLWMYATPVIYPIGMVKGDKLRFAMQLNPLTGIFEAAKHGLFGSGVFSWGMLAYSACFTIVLIMLGIVVFNRVQKSFIDTV